VNFMWHLFTPLDNYKLFLFIVCIFVYIVVNRKERLQGTWSQTLGKHLSSWSLSNKASCVLDHVFLWPNNIYCYILTYACTVRSNWRDLIGYLELLSLYLIYTWFTYWVDLLDNVKREHWSWFIIVDLLSMIKLFCLIGTWRTNRENSATTRLLWLWSCLIN
jgi:hypothetical protein